MGPEGGPLDAGRPRRGAAVPNYNRREAGSDEQAIVDDADLVTSAALAGFDVNTPEWAELVKRLYPYAVSSLRAWTRQGTIFHKLMRIGVADRIQGEPVDLTADQCDQLARDVIVDALGKFRKNVLLKRVWDPERGTQLTTFFVRYCLYQFPDHYNRIRMLVTNENQRHETLPEHPDAQQRTADSAVARLEIARIIDECLDGEKDDAILLAGWLDDLPLREIADELGVPYKAAEYRRAKLRYRLEMSRSA